MEQVNVSGQQMNLTNFVHKSWYVFCYKKWDYILKMNRPTVYNGSITKVLNTDIYSAILSFLLPSWSQLQWNVSITKSCGWRNYIRYNEISLHWNTLKCHTDVYTGDLVVRLRSNRTEAEDLARVYTGRSWSHGHWTAGRIQSIKCLHCRLSFKFHSTEIATNELVNVDMQRQIIRTVENEDVYTGELVVRQQSNRTKGKSFCFSWIETLADWSRRNTASFDSDLPM
jgi:hypothetical protein